MNLYLMGISLAGGTVAFVSFIGCCCSALLLRDPDPDKQEKSRRILFFCFMTMLAGAYVLANPEGFHPDNLAALRARLAEMF